MAARQSAMKTLIHVFFMQPREFDPSLLPPKSGTTSKGILKRSAERLKSRSLREAPWSRRQGRCIREEVSRAMAEAGRLCLIRFRPEPVASVQQRHPVRLVE